MANKNESRRKLLKSIAVGGGAVVVGKSLPESWSRPVVDTVMLPAHAATTNDPCCLIAGKYCAASIGQIFIQLTVGIDGAIAIQVDGFYPAIEPMNASISCTGDSFSVTSINDLRVTGTVTCGATEISGNIFLAQVVDEDFIATTGGCNPNI